LVGDVGSRDIGLFRGLVAAAAGEPL
jgi:hypothetical protein